MWPSKFPCIDDALNTLISQRNSSRFCSWALGSLSYVLVIIFYPGFNRLLVHLVAVLSNLYHFSGLRSIFINWQEKTLTRAVRVSFPKDCTPGFEIGDFLFVSSKKTKGSSLPALGIWMYLFGVISFAVMFLNYILNRTC